MTAGQHSKSEDRGYTYVYVSWHIWQTAADAAQRSKSVLLEHPEATTADTLSAIVLSVAAAEAFINELAFDLAQLMRYGPNSDASVNNMHAVGEVLEELEQARATTSGKFLTASLLLPGEPFKKGEQPFQDFCRVIAIRNDLIHPKMHHRSPPYLRDLMQRGLTYYPGHGTFDV